MNQGASLTLRPQVKINVIMAISQLNAFTTFFSRGDNRHRGGEI
ncbi:hypothetical protein O53_3988 [Microcystis aeruginosa TAIHU98]|uniref:Uncharacterized protein n=1 Tax=Microcystis aeruginosa TAIHU98 TaxID=1134457 RepID=L7E811_MICAE|nr:hypothetical protein O53_3988 [Microcystis aeruginosa TAIHU98]ODV36052.1 hypothetical protein BFG60_4493 [Microcystis aeruginosa NIES-98]